MQGGLSRLQFVKRFVFPTCGGLEFYPTRGGVPTSDSAADDLHWHHAALINMRFFSVELQHYLDDFYCYNRRMYAAWLFSRLTREFATSGCVQCRGSSVNIEVKI